MRRQIVLGAAWMVSCASLFLAGWWLNTAGENLGASLLFVGVPVVSVYWIWQIFHRRRRY